MFADFTKILIFTLLMDCTTLWAGNLATSNTARCVNLFNNHSNAISFSNQAFVNLLRSTTHKTDKIQLKKLLKDLRKNNLIFISDKAAAQYFGRELYDTDIKTIRYVDLKINGLISHRKSISLRLYSDVSSHTEIILKLPKYIDASNAEYIDAGVIGVTRNKKQLHYFNGISNTVYKDLDGYELFYEPSTLLKPTNI